MKRGKGGRMHEGEGGGVKVSVTQTVGKRAPGSISFQRHFSTPSEGQRAWMPNALPGNLENFTCHFHVCVII